jgi:hypothetical protein
MTNNSTDWRAYGWHQECDLTTEQIVMSVLLERLRGQNVHHMLVAVYDP